MKDYNKIIKETKNMSSLLKSNLASLESIIQGSGDLLKSKYPNLISDLEDALSKNDFKKIMEIQKDLQNAD